MKTWKKGSNASSTIVWHPKLILSFPVFSESSKSWARLWDLSELESLLKNWMRKLSWPWSRCNLNGRNSRCNLRRIVIFCEKKKKTTQYLLIGTNNLKLPDNSKKSNCHNIYHLNFECKLNVHNMSKQKIRTIQKSELNNCSREIVQSYMLYKE